MGKGEGESGYIYIYLFLFFDFIHTREILIGQAQQGV